MQRICFCRVKNLENLNLSSFNTSNVTTISYMINNCSSLKYLDIRNAELSKVSTCLQPFMV